MEQQREKNSTSLVLKNRSSLFINGVLDILSSDENLISLNTNDGGLEIGGADLKIKNMNVENKEITVEGIIDSLIYNDKNQPAKGGFFARIFK